MKMEEGGYHADDEGKATNEEVAESQEIPVQYKGKITPRRGFKTSTVLADNTHTSSFGTPASTISPNSSTGSLPNNMTACKQVGNIIFLSKMLGPKIHLKGYFKISV